MVLHLQRKLIAVVTGLVLLAGTIPAAVFSDDTSGNPTGGGEAAASEPAEPADSAVDGPADPAAPANDSETEASENTLLPSDSGQEAAVISVKTFITGISSETGQPERWIDNRTVEIGKTANGEGLLTTVLGEDGNYKLDEDGNIQSIRLTNSGKELSLSTGDAREGLRWLVKVNGYEPQRSIPLKDYVFSDGDRVEFYYGRIEENWANSDEAAVLTSGLSIMASDAQMAYSTGNTKDLLIANCDKAGWSFESDWAVIGCARGGLLTDVQIQAYYANVLSKLDKSGTSYAEYSSDISKLIMALTSVGKDVTNVSGHNLLEAISNMKFVTAQGINGPLWALIAFDSGNYAIPETTGEGAVQATREKLISLLIAGQHSDGGWSYNGPSDIDMTAMIITGLAPYYKTDANVKTAIDKALAWLSSRQNSKGQFTTGDVSSESQSQVIVALSTLGIDAAKDSRFVKKGRSAIDALLDFYVKGGGYKHVESNWKYNGLATVQGNYAMIAYYRYLDGQQCLYDMTDYGNGYVVNLNYKKDEGKPANPDDKNKDVKAEGKTRGLTRGGGLIKLSGAASEKTNEVIAKIKAVNGLALPGDAEDYGQDQIDRITEAYKAYYELSPAEKLAIEKDKCWKKYSGIIAKLGKVYHYDRETGVDFRDNKEEVLPWYVKLVVTKKEFTDRQKEKILGLLGEEGEIFSSYNVRLVNTLDGSKKWKPGKILDVTFDLPNKGTIKNAVVIHIGRNGRVEFIDGEINGEGSTISFKAAEFSTYGIAGGTAELRSTAVYKKMNVIPWCLAAIGTLAAVLLIVMVRRKIAEAGDK
ncbi:MAG: terpene cyclase/mutase family protein [Bacillota bacterium]|nr:terpene cyclase/mutase family protein [Bacillota bacterium]